MADRSKGALPTVFERKNPLTRLLTMYQVEVNNQLRHLFKDLPDDLKEKGIAALVAGLMKYTIGAYLFNDLYESWWADARRLTSWALRTKPLEITQDTSCRIRWTRPRKNMCRW